MGRPVAGQPPNLRGELLKVRLLAATSAEPAMVRLRWFPEDGWPAGDFKLYRSDGSGRQELIAQTGYKRGGVNGPRPGAQTQSRSLDEVWASASRVLPAQAPGIGTPAATRQKVSSLSTFAEARTAVNQVLAAPKSRGAMEAKLAERLAVPTTKHARLLPKASPSARPPSNQRQGNPAAAQVSANAQTQMDRDKLLYLALLQESAAKDLGLAFTDRRVLSRGSYTYELSIVENGVERPVASVAVEIGSNDKPPTPVVETPFQYAQNTAALKAELPANANENAFGMLSLRVERQVAGGNPVPVNDKPLAFSFTPTADGKLIAPLVTLYDVQAPRSGKVRYLFRSEDIFGRLSDPAIAEAEMRDLATPVAAPITRTAANPNAAIPDVTTQLARLGVRATSALIDGKGERPHRVMVYWTKATYATDELDAQGQALPNTPGNTFQYMVEQIEPEPRGASTVVVAAAPGAPVDLSLLTLGTLFQLRPDWEQVLLSWAKKLPKGLQTTLAEAQQLPGMEINGDNWQFVVNGILQQEVAPKDDAYYNFRVSPILTRNERIGESITTTKIGVPAFKLPSAPTALQLSEGPAPTVASGFAAGKGVTNAIRLQGAPGVEGPAGVINPNNLDARAAGQKIMAPKQAAKNASTRNGGGNAPKMLNAAGSTTTQQSAARRFAVVNFGRKVTLKWTPPGYSSELKFHVYRAIGSGFVPASAPIGASAPPASGPPILAGPQKNAGTLSGAQKPQAARAQVPKTAPFSQGAVHAGGKVFARNRVPSDSEYILLGATDFRKNEFIDLTPRSQATTYFYKVVPVNRWGATGAPSAPLSIKVLPSMKPSTPKLAKVVAALDPANPVRIVVETNPIEEEVRKYEVYRIEVPTPPQAPSAVNSAGSTGGNAGALRPRISVQRSSSPATTLARAQGALSGVSQAPQSLDPKFFTLPSYQLIKTVPADDNTPAELEIFDPTAQPERTYVYRVRAVNSANLNSDPSALFDVTVLKLTADAPTLAAQPQFDGVNGLITFSLSPPATGAAGYVVYRAILSSANDTSGVFRQLDSLASTPVTPFVDRSVRSGRVYRYRIVALDSAGNLSSNNPDPAKRYLEFTVVPPP